jgi:hypothetical protein
LEWIGKRAHYSINFPIKLVGKVRGDMTEDKIEIRIADQTAHFTLHWDSSQWDSPDDITQADFPLIAHSAGRRYELYSDGTFSQVEK